MRTTVTLDEDAEQLVRERMAQRGVSFKQAVNDSIREGNRRRGRRAGPSTKTASLGVPSVNLDRALQVAAELEDEELVRRMRRGG
jgi:hypothetical protein